ncbi:tyrosine-type recombinase/integrase [Corynebacterium variabile]|uniref:tyrosine-type recombinase/integrase n=1 Tax=Corynebacterium variabile TaxID=1727 RepID=UPI003FD4CAF2
MAIDQLPSGSYRVRVFSRGDIVATEYFKRKRDAQTFERNQKVSLAAGTWVSPDSGRMTVKELVKLWRTTKEFLAPRSLITLDSVIGSHVLPALGSRPIAVVSPAEVQQWASGLVQSHSPATARQALNPLRQAYRMAVRDGYVSRSPVDHVKLPQARPDEPRPLTVPQVQALTTALPGERDRLMVEVMAFGGLRWSECAGLRAQDVRATDLRLLHAVTYPKGGGFLLKDLKNHEARSVPLPSSVMRRLLDYVTLMDPEAFVFGSAAATPMERGNWVDRTLAPAVTASGLSRKVTPHHFRDTAASLAISTGADVVRVSRLLGHRDGSVTLKHYASLFPGGLDEVAAGLDALLTAPKDRAGDNP